MIHMDSENVAIPMNSTGMKKSKGRQKMEMKKIGVERYLRVTFSKRRNGVFKKASELATLCGVDIAVIMFSPGNRVFSFGRPSVDSVIQRYTEEDPLPVLTQDLNETHSTADEAELHAHLNRLSTQIAVERKRQADLNRSLNAAEDHFWWAGPIQKMDKAQLHKYKNMLQDLNARINQKKSSCARQA